VLDFIVGCCAASMRGTAPPMLLGSAAH